MALEARQVYRVQPSDADRLVDQLNQILQFIADRLDKSESLRDDARMYGDLTVDGDIVCEGDLTVGGALGGGDAIAETVVIGGSLTVGDQIITTNIFITGFAEVGSLLIGDDYVFGTEGDTPEQTAVLYSHLVAHGHADIGGDITGGSDMTLNGDASIAGDLTAKSGVVHGQWVLVDDNGQQIHGWIAP